MSRQHEAGEVGAALAGADILTVDGRAVLVERGPRPKPTVHDLGPGAVVDQHDNLAFGHWNRIVAWLPSRRAVRVFAGHGGEILPGRFDDHVERMRSNILTGVDRPIQLDLDLSMACPSNCGFCFSKPYREARSEGRLMDPAAVDRTIDGFAAQGVKVIRFDGGGDPLTHPHLMAAIARCAGHGITTAVLTAGDLLRPAMFDTLVEAGTYVRVSLNAATDATRLEIHSPRRLKFALTNVLDALHGLNERRLQQWGADPRESMLLGTTSMIEPRNVHETFQIAEAARDAGADHLSMRVVLGRDHAVSFTDAQRDQFAEQRDRVLAELVDDRFQVFFPTRNLSDEGYVPSSYFDTCRASTHRALVEVGRSPDTPAIVPCGRYRGEGYLDDGSGDAVTYGTLGPGDDLAEVWMGEGMARRHASFPDACGDCIDRSANQLLDGLASAITADPGAQFVRFASGDLDTH